MAKKFGKFLALAAIAGAAAGAYYYYKNKSGSSDYDDFDDFEDEDEDTLEDYLREEAHQSEQTERSLKDIFPINLSSDTVNEARETLKKAVLDIGEKVADVAGSITGVVKGSDTDVEVEDFQFYDLSDENGNPPDKKEDQTLDVINTKKAADVSEKAEEVAEAVSEKIEEAADEAAAIASDAVAAVREAATEQEQTSAEILFESSGDEDEEEVPAEDEDKNEEFSFEE